MTLPEIFERYDDEHLANLYAIQLLDGAGDDDRRTARICATITTVVMNALRLSGKEVPDSLYRDERHFIPAKTKLQARQRQFGNFQTWDQMRQALTF